MRRAIQKDGRVYVLVVDSPPEMILCMQQEGSVGSNQLPIYYLCEVKYFRREEGVEHRMGRAD